MTRAEPGEVDRYEAVFEHALDAFVLADDEGRYVDANPAACELFGLERDELVGRSIDEFAPANYDFETAWREFNESDAETGRFPLERPDGTVRIVEYAATSNVRPGEHLSVLRDVTEQVRRHEELERQNERLEEFAGVVSHDLRNPLGVASGFLDLVREQNEAEGVVDDRLDRVASALARMDAIVADLLTATREGQLVTDFEDVSLAGIAEAAWSMVETDDANVVVESDPTLSADPDRLQRVLENLFRNAIQHGGPGVAVRVGGTERGFFVEDDGPGVPVEKREEIFEPGFTTGDGGTGFGLVIVRNLVRAHGWEITAIEGRDGGARFEVVVTPSAAA